MGYTHYWKFTKTPSEITNGKEKFKKAVSLFKKGLKHIPSEIEVSKYKWNEENGSFDTYTEKVPFLLGGLDGTGEPVITDTTLYFNGKDNDAYESFAVDYTGHDWSFNFCKTARHIYDVAVCLALLCLKKAFGEDFSYSSDGDIKGGEEGWKLAKEIMAKIAS